MDKATIIELYKLYEVRDRIKCAGDSVRTNTTIEKFCESFSIGAGYSSAIADAVGGEKALREVFVSALENEINSQIVEIDSKIKNLGGNT